MLPDLAEIPGASGRGLLGRFLYALPTVNVGNRNAEPDPAEPATHAAYASTLHALALSVAERDGEAKLTLSPEATAHRRDASARYEKRVADEGDLAGIRD